MNKRHLLGLLALVPTVWLAGCGGGSGGNASVRLVNASTGYDTLDLYVNDAKVSSSAVTTGKVSAFADVGSGTVTTALATSTSATYLLSQSRNLSKDTKYTIVAYGWQGAPHSTVITENIPADTSATPKAKVGIVNTAIDAGTLNVYLTGPTDDLSGSAVATVQGGMTSSYAPVLPGTYRLRVTLATDPTDVRLDIPAVTLASGEVDTLVLYSGAGGTLVSAAQVIQGVADVKSYPNTQARVRMVSALTGTGDQATVALNGTTFGLPKTASPYIGDYGLVSAGSASVAVNGTVLTTAAFNPGTDNTLMVLGTAAAPSVVVLSDDNRLPTLSTNYKVRFVNAMNPVDLASYPLTMVVDDASIGSNVLPGGFSAYKTKPTTTSATIEVRSALQQPMVSKTTVNFAAQSVYTFFMFGNATPATWSGQKSLDR